MNPKHKEIDFDDFDETGEETIPVNDKRRFNEKGERVAPAADVDETPAEPV